MNNQQAINLLKDLEQGLDDYCGLNDEGKAAFRMAITALELFGNAEQLPSAQTEHTETHSCENQHTETHDLVSRRAALEAMDTWDKFGCDPDGKLVRYDDDKHYVPYVHYEDMVHAVKNLPSAEPESRREWYMKGYRDAQQRWIPFKTRPLTDEEKEECPDYDVMLDCQLPENGQRILVNVKWNGHEFVQMDEYYDDDGSYLDSGYEIGSEATAWMPLPEPWKGGQDEQVNRR